ncbi:MAG: hypothetical protein MI976_24025 [Pseudomonadales bacterium]|nr:hypothetical protein [Pseudomonadales bacterium]
MDLGKNQSIRLEEQDEYTHPIEAAKNFNESMYINLFDHQQQIGGWFRVGNRPNEGYAEVSCCLYLPDGQVAFMFQRPEISNNDAIAAGGMAFTIVEPFKKLTLTHSGKVCLLKDPTEMANPKEAFKNNPILDCEISINFRGIAPVYGGEAVDENGNPVEESPDESFARAHYEQHMAGEGTIKVGDTEYELKNGLGLRDHSWGPRYWQNLYWYRWLPMCFNEDFAMNISIVTMASGKQHIWGMVLEGNEYHLIEESSLQTNYDDNYYPLGYTAQVKTAHKEYTIEAAVISQIPLRNRRQKDNGEWMKTRIIEGFTRFQCNGLVGYGMTEYLDQMVDEIPVGKAV